MKHRIHLALALSVVAAAGTAPSAASANPGLLHKHGARPIGVPGLLPGQSAAGGAMTTTAGTAATTSSIAVAGVAPGSNGCVVVSGGVDGPVVTVADGLPVGGPLGDGGPAVDPGQLPICVMPVPDGRGPGHHGGPNVFHHLNPGAIGGDPGAIDSGAIDPGMVMVDGPPPGFAWGAVDAGSSDGAGPMPVVLYAALPPGGQGRDGGGTGFVHQPMGASMAMASSTADVAGGGGRDLAAGLPNRAAGVRTDSLATIRHHGHRPATKAAGVAVGGEDASGGVVQAGGGADDAAGTPPRDRSSKVTASAVAGQVAVPPAATAAPRWRDRLRFAWPTKP